MIVKEKGGFSVYSEDGSKHLGGPYPSKQEAERRLAQIEFYKSHPKAK